MTPNGYLIFPQSTIQSCLNNAFSLQKDTYILASDLSTLGATLMMNMTSQCWLIFYFVKWFLYIDNIHMKIFDFSWII